MKRWRQWPRVYWFEIFTIVNLIVIDLILRRIGFTIFQLLTQTVVRVGISLVIQLVVGVLIRAVIAFRRGEPYLAIVRSPRFLLDTPRFLAGTIFMSHIYGWLKVAVPALNPRLYDQFFWDLDRALFFGLSPNLFFVQMFSHPLAMRAVDWTYANVFLGSIFISGAYFLSSPRHEERVAFINANVTMWIAGAWLYVALPALDPCYRFPDIWLPLQKSLPQTQFLQGLLWKNYAAFHALMAGKPAQVDLMLGLSAFPSLHTACVFLAFLFLRKHSRATRLLYAVFTLIIFIGSVVTGWHYLADSLAGLLLGGLAYAAFRPRPERFPTHEASDRTDVLAG